MNTKQEPKKKIWPFGQEGYFEEETKPKAISSFEFSGFEKETKPVRPIRSIRQEILFSYQEKYQEAALRTEIKEVVEAVKKEVVKLETEQKVLLADISKITVEHLPNKPGIYHLRFFQWLLSLIKPLRQKVNESRTWLAAFNSKKSQRTYWKMYKKRGTSFGLSGERVIATQAG